MDDPPLAVPHALSSKPLPRITAVLLATALVLGSVIIPAPSASAATFTVGVVSSASSKAFSAGSPPHPFARGTDVAGREEAARTWVEDNGHDLVVLSDADLADPSALAAVDVVILPYTWSINENASLTLRNWVEQGGGLIPVLSSPRVFLDDGVWKLWVKALNYEAWEWGPLSEAYQMMFLDDPSPSSWKAKLRPGHPIVTKTLNALGLSSAQFSRPSPSGVEFGHKYNSNVTSILDYADVGPDPKGKPLSKYNGFSAAQATHYGAGRIVYFDIPVLDFLPHYNSDLADDPVDGGHDQGDLVDALLDAAVDWAVTGGGTGTISPVAVTWGEVDAWGTAIYVRHWVKATGTVPVLGQLTAKFYDPSGKLVKSNSIPILGIEPGRTHMYNWRFINTNNAPLANGRYRVLLEYKYTYPDYTLRSRAEAYVTRAQGQNIPTQPVSANVTHTVLVGDFDGSGETDLALFNSTDGKWWVLESNGSSFSPDLWADFSTASGWIDRLSGDFNEDGRDDIAQFHPSNGTWWVSRSTGSGFSTELWADYSTASGWRDRLAGDFDGDGRDDIAQFHPSNGTWWISRSTGSRFSTTLWADYSTASGWQARMAGDFDGDGRDDIAQFHPSNGTWWVSRSTGSGFATTLWADYTTASGWENRMVGDFNGDGRDDIAQFHPSNGTWWVSPSTGSGFSTRLWGDFSTSSGWQAHLSGDFNGDGRDDIAQFHPSNGTWWVSRSTGSGFATALWADYTTASGWSHRVVGDFNDDGRDDIVQTHGSNGTWWVSRSTGSSFSTTKWATFTGS